MTDDTPDFTSPRVKLNPQEPITIERLAQIIRTVDGSNSLGAAALAEEVLRKVGALTPQEPPGWRPIAEAPRDSSQIIAGYETERGWFCDIYDAEADGFAAVTHGFSRDVAPLTHWQPLPEPPAEEPRA